MNISKELLEKAKTAKSAEELLEMAKAENIELNAEEAAQAFAKMNKNGELSDEELDNVAGGGCQGRPPKFSLNDRVSHEGSDGKAVYGTVVGISSDFDYLYQVVDDGETTEKVYYESELIVVGCGGTDPEICKSIM